MMGYEEAKVQETVFTPSPVHPIPSSSSSTSSSSTSSFASTLTSRKPDLFDPTLTQPQPRPSLIRYQPPQPADKAASTTAPPITSAALQAAGGGGKRKAGEQSGASAKPLSSLSEVLNAILPPRELVDPATGARQVQFVSTEASSREEVIALQKQLDDSLQERQARESGICPVREELYSQCFDELIRQVCIASPERGLLLLRLRDELRMSVSSYQALYASSITFGQRKGLQAELGRDELTSRLSGLEEERRASQRLLLQQKAVYDALEKRINEQRAAEEKKQAEEKEFLKYQAQHLEAFIKSAQQ